MPRRIDPTMVPSRRNGSGRGSTRRWLVVLTGLVSLLGGCAPDDELPLPPVVWEGTSVRVRMDDPGIEVCGGSFEALDRHAELVREALLLEGDGIIEYSIGEQDFVESVCSHPELAPGGCATFPAGHIYTREPFNPHEIVHAARIQDPAIGFLSLAFEEGLATVFGSDPPGDGTIPLETLGILEDSFVGGANEYFRAGHAMAILLDRNGVETFRRFDMRARTTDEDRAFLEEFGETKEEFAAFADASPVCERSYWRRALLECDGEPLVAEPGTGDIVLSGFLDCDESAVRGPEYGRMWTSRHFRLDAPTNYLRYRFDVPDDATVEIIDCRDGCPGRFVYSGTRDDLGSFGNGLPNLEPGEYFLRMSRPIDAVGDGWFELSIR